MKIKPNLKAIVAAIGTTLVAVSTFLTALTFAVGDDAISIEEVSTLAGALATLVGTVYGVWKADNSQSPSK